MARYIALIDWTDQGVQNFKSSVDRYDAAAALLRSKGVDFVDVYWTLGGHDLVAILEAPDDQILAAGMLAISSQGNLRSTTLRAFTADEMRDVIGKVG